MDEAKRTEIIAFQWENKTKQNKTMKRPSSLSDELKLVEKRRIAVKLWKRMKEEKTSDTIEKRKTPSRELMKGKENRSDEKQYGKRKWNRGERYARGNTWGGEREKEWIMNEEDGWFGNRIVKKMTMKKWRLGPKYLILLLDFIFWWEEEGEEIKASTFTFAFNYKKQKY